jgi:hypothetical protein
MQIGFRDLRNWWVAWERKIDFLPKFKLALVEHEWVVYPFFTLLVVIFLLLLPRGCRYP